MVSVKYNNKTRDEIVSERLEEEDAERGLYDFWLQDEGLTMLAAWRRNGLSYLEIAKRIGIRKDRLKRWREMYDSIDNALKTGKELLDFQVENALLKAALGYTTKEIKVTLGKKVISGETFQVLKETTVKEVGPNVTACLAWLNNRKPDDWKRNRDNQIDPEKIDKDVTVTIIRAGNNKIEGVNDNQNDGVSITVNGHEAIEDKNHKKVKVVTDEEAQQGGLDYWPDDYEEENEES